MGKKFFIIIFMVTLLTVVLIFVSSKNNENIGLNESPRVRVAVCPTCMEIANKLDSSRYEIVPTIATSESILLLEDNQADLMLAGRTLMSYEPEMDSIIITKGYSFLGDAEIIILTNKLKDYTIYTDLDTVAIRNNFEVKDVIQVNDIYAYLNKGIVITSWENTDYNKAKMVHILQEGGERLALSRQPTIYCPSSCSKEAKDLLVSLK